MVDEDGAVLATVRRDSPATSRQAIFETIAAVANELAVKYDAPTIGVGAAGFTSSDRNTMVHGTNLDWTGARLADEVGGCTGTRVVENDANAAGWAAAGSILPTPVREGLDSGRARHQPVRVPTCGRASRRA